MSNFYRLDNGSWVSPDIKEGVGRSNVNFTAPPYEGREDRITVRIVRSGENMKAVTLRQLGELVVEANVERLDYPIGGGVKQVLIETNAASLNASIAGKEHGLQRCKIKAFTTASGLDIMVGDSKLDYAFPGDPGKEEHFQVSLLIEAPDNSKEDPLNETLIINGIIIPIAQPGYIAPYINVNNGEDFVGIGPDETSLTIPVESNIEGYTISIVECESERIPEVTLDKTRIRLSKNGEVQYVNVITSDQDLNWEVRELK